MQPNNTSTITHQGTLGNAHQTQFGLDQSSLVHLMSVLTDLYSDPAGAVIREYATNAFDSHREAGIDDPIEVELPSALNPVFIVRDHGIGMSKDEIEKNYGQYGYSSKRETNDQVGMLGLGCKSALTYTSQFTLTAVKDGLRTVVLITRDEQGVGRLQVIGEPSTTDDRNGVEISIPVNDWDEIECKARQFFTYWEPGTVLINGVEPASVFDNDDYIVLDPDVLIRKTFSRTDNRIIMGNVPYRFDLPYGTLPHNWEVVARVPIGTVAFTPSREDLMDTDVTRDTIQSMVRFVKDTWLRSTQAKIDAMTSKEDVVRFCSEVNQTFRNRFTWNGTPVPTSVKIERGWVWSGSQSDDRAASLDGFTSLTKIYDANLVVTGVKRVTGALKEQTTHYWTEVLGNARHCRAYFLETNYSPEWITDTISIDTIREHAPKKARKVREKAKYNVVGNWNDLIQEETLDPHARIIRTPASMDRTFRSDLRGLAEQVTGNNLLVSVRKNSETKFIEEHPSSMDIEEFLQLAKAEYESGLTAEMVFYEECPYEFTIEHRYSRMGESVHDPELKKFIEVATTSGTGAGGIALHLLSRCLRTQQPYVEIKIKKPNTDHLVDLGHKMKKRYPFIFRSRQEGVDAAWAVNQWYNSTLHAFSEEMEGTDVLDEMFPSLLHKEID